MSLDLEHEFSAAGAQYWGQYFANRFYFKLYTYTRKDQIPSYDRTQYSFSDEDQLKLQRLNYVTLFHEYIHYIHEMSTMIGITDFYFECVKRGIFADFVDLPASSEYLGISGSNYTMFKNLGITTNAIYSGAAATLANRLVFEIIAIELKPFAAYAPFEVDRMGIKIPFVTYKYIDRITKKEDVDSFFLGKFYLYEGLAYELDRIVDAQLEMLDEITDLDIGSEYKVLRLISKYLCPNLEKRSVLETASLALSYLNAGQIFVEMLIALHDASDKQALMQEQRSETSLLLQECLEGMEYTLTSITETFAKRSSLHRATQYLTKVMLEGFKKRIADPTFEIRLTYQGHTRKLTEFIPLCDYMYVLEDDDDYMRDFLGTYIDPNISFDLKVLLCHVDYYYAMIAEKKEHCCPLYYSCNYKFRQENAMICYTTPRLTYELNKISGDFCPYSRGITYMKLTDIA